VLSDNSSKGTWTGCSTALDQIGDIHGPGAMSDTALSDRQIKLLAVVAEGGGDWDARRIDLTVNASAASANVCPDGRFLLRPCRLCVAVMPGTHAGAECRLAQGIAV
jgi:hypothetical protein